MKETIINGKLYIKIGGCKKLPIQDFPEDMLKNNQPERSKREDTFTFPRYKPMEDIEMTPKNIESMGFAIETGLIAIKESDAVL